MSLCIEYGPVFSWIVLKGVRKHKHNPFPAFPFLDFITDTAPEAKFNENFQYTLTLHGMSIWSCSASVHL